MDVSLRGLGWRPVMRVAVAVMTVLATLTATGVLTVATAVCAKGQEKPLMLAGRVKEAVFKNDLPDAWVYTIDGDGNRCDSLKVGSIQSFLATGLLMNTERSEFSLMVDRRDSVYVFEVGCKGYRPQTVVYEVKGAGSRETYRSMPVVYLEREPHRLKEVQVTASKVKFYHRGDTVVYNADAFQLAEGSMLDALIAQLPGVELKDGGRITVNGEFVESLLLNGKQFFDGNKEVMLNNIGAYTVKNVEVYRGHSQMQKFHGDITGPQQLTMDVKFKREYSIGTIVNAQGGYGSENRYMGRLFGARFTSTTEVNLVANFNNLNDNREPGKNDSWSPDRMPTGTRRYQMAGLNYNYTSPEASKAFASGNVTYTANRLNHRSYTDRTNFFSLGNTYDYTHNTRRYRDFSINTRHMAGRKVGKVSLSGSVGGQFSRTDNTNTGLSASFNDEQATLSLQALETIYTTGSPEQLASIINRSSTRGDGFTRRTNLNGGVTASYVIPNSPDRITTSVSAQYTTEKAETWQDYAINYGNNPVATSRRRNFTDNSPNRNLNLTASTGYSWTLGKVNGNVAYKYSFLNRDRDSYMYALDRLGEDMGVFGSLPAGYLSTLDAGNSYVSRLYENKHELSASLRYNRTFDDGGNLQIGAYPCAAFQHSHLNYFSDGTTYPVRRSTALLYTTDIGASVRYQCGGPRNGTTMHIITLKYRLATDTPDLLHLVDVTNTSDPLNISLGNAGLRNSYTNTYGLFYMVAPHGTSIRNGLTVDFAKTNNALVRGYYYDRTTGVRYNRTYNVHGNNSLKAENSFDLQFGRRKQFTLQSTTGAANVHSVDMVGTDGVDPSPSKVDTRTLSEALRLSWQIGRHTISVNGSVTDRHTTSSREGFATIDATHYNYGLSGTFTLPAGFGLSTDFRMFTRRGYGVPELDSTDAVWNARLSYRPKGGRWVIMVDGFDLLHRLSNVQYAVTATGRTVTYTNTLPRYILASVQYRFSVQPKKR